MPNRSTIERSEKSISHKIATELAVAAAQVEATVALLDEGATVPFIARYRKEVTGGLDDAQLRDLEDRLRYLRELTERKQVVLASIEEQGKLSPELAAEIAQVEGKTALEDIYLPFKPKRRSKAMIAREAGLEALADALFQDPTRDPQSESVSYISEKVPDSKSALEGAKHILMERFSEDAVLIGSLRDHLWNKGELRSKVFAEKSKEAEKYQDYFDYAERIKNIPSHRALAVFRGRKEGFLALSISTAGLEEGASDPCEQIVADYFSIQNQGRPADTWLQEVVRWTWRIKLLMHLETDLFGKLRDDSQGEAIRVFAENLKAILLASPAGNKVTMGLDPGLRTGVKVCVVDHTGKYLEDTAIYPHAPRHKWDDSIHALAVLCKKHQVDLVSIGNGTASRETDKLVGDLMKRHSELKLRKVMVSESGASVYSASEIARKEFPNLDVTVRGAISIARRLQDPLAELVKIDPQSIGVGQYQHDVSQLKLGQALDAVVEDCVNAVGVDVNMASEPLLRRVSGVSSTLAANIVEFRNSHGEFKSRQELKSVPRFGEKSFEQAAGFLRVVNGSNALDSSAVHPESYKVVEQIAQDSKRDVANLIGDGRFLQSLMPKDYVSATVGLPTVTDILQELEKPGRDPRPEFKTAEFKEGVETLSDLQAGMILEGVITNVTNFGAFVDVGVHQDGLVHISALSTSYVKDPHTIVKTGQVVKVKVMDCDIKRKRIAMSMRLDDQPGENSALNSAAVATTKQKNPPHRAGISQHKTGPSHTPVSNKPAKSQVGSFGDLLKSAQKGR